MDNNLRDKLLKIQELARRGTTHEREVAASKLVHLLEKHQLTLADIEKEKQTEHCFSYNTRLERSLLLHIYASTMGVSEVRYARRKRETKLYFDLTDDEAFEIREKYARYRVALREEIDLLFRAFVQRHHLTAPADGSRVDIDPEELKRLWMLAQALRPVAPNGQLLLC